MVITACLLAKDRRNIESHRDSLNISLALCTHYTVPYVQLKGSKRFVEFVSSEWPIQWPTQRPCRCLVSDSNTGGCTIEELLGPGQELKRSSPWSTETLVGWSVSWAGICSE